MEEIKDEALDKINYYIPHHSVYKPEKTSTPLRVIFDASAKTTSGFSLNSILLNGGIIQQDLFFIVSRFRKHEYAFSADIKKMYRQILVDPNQKDLQRIMWKTSADAPVKTYKLATSTLECAKRLQTRLSQLLLRGDFELHKWVSNSPELLKDLSASSYVFDKEFQDAPVKTLGTLWDQKMDCLTYKVKIIDKVNFSKKDVLSEIARFYDPLGLIGPIVTKAKIFIQELWKIKLDWSDQLLPDATKEWKNFYQKLSKVNNFKIPRCILLPATIRFEIHGLSDASERAYATVVYIKCFNESGQSQTRLLCSKSRVAPLKTLTIPRFINNIKAKESCNKEKYLTADELKRSTVFLAKIAQLSEFKAEIDALKNGKGVSKTSNLKALDPFLDENSLLRVGGRLSIADLPFEAKHQIISSTAVRKVGGGRPRTTTAGDDPYIILQEMTHISSCRRKEAVGSQQASLLSNFL
ncbi:integrase catalytic domain-containing protein [Trichonephila clavipes]|nr:integrase catalytic domain-containing protein [Trichonephila clavipes]